MIPSTVYMLIAICIQSPFANGESPYALWLGPIPVCTRGVPVPVYANGDSPYAYGDVVFVQPSSPLNHASQRAAKLPIFAFPFACELTCLGERMFVFT